MGVEGCGVERPGCGIDIAGDRMSVCPISKGSHLCLEGGRYWGCSGMLGAEARKGFVLAFLLVGHGSMKVSLFFDP
jgi:hypothetical protein